jgi:hypothetical protein
LDWHVAWARAGIALGVLVFVAGVAFSGGTSVDPPVPRGFPGAVPAFLASARGAPGEGTQVDLEDGARTAWQRDRRWLARARALGRGAPDWARRMYRRSLLVLRALVDRRGAAVAGARAGWAHVWPRDAGAVTVALAAAGYRAEARRVARFLLGLDLGAAARFNRDGGPVEGRGAQGDAAGWVAAAARAAGIHGPVPGTEHAAAGVRRPAWRNRADYQEGDAGDYVGDAIAAGASSDLIARAFGDGGTLARTAGDPGSGADSAAAWAVRPFPRPALFPMVRRTLLRLVADRGTRFGLLPSQDWDGGEDPWTAPTAWTAWAFAALAREDPDRGRRAADRRAALGLMADLRRAATPLGLLPERVDARTGLPTSTTPLAWSHAFAILAIRELWPGPPSRAAKAAWR